MRKLLLLLFALSIVLLVVAAHREVCGEDQAGDVLCGHTWASGMTTSQGVEVEGDRISSAALVFGLHLYVVADLPFEYGVRVHLAALEFGLDPYDLAAVLISEHSGGDSDFSLFSSSAYREMFQYDPQETGRFAKGSEKERGLFQIKPSWVRGANKHLGTVWTADDLFDPAVNIRVGAFVLQENIASHEECEHAAESRGLVGSYHTAIAHWKCVSSARDDIVGQCRVAQRKWDKIRGSLTAIWPVDVASFGRSHNVRVRRVIKSYQRQSRHLLRVKIRKLCEKHDVSVPDGLKKMSVEQLWQELSWLQDATGVETE